MQLYLNKALENKIHRVHSKRAVSHHCQSVSPVYLHFGFGFLLTSTTDLSQKMAKVQIHPKLFYHPLILQECVLRRINIQ